MYVKPLDMAATFGMLSPLLRKQADLELRHIIEVRLYLEPPIAGLAARQRTEADLGVLEDCLLAMCGNLDERGCFVASDMAFHQELARCSGNPLFHVIMASIADLLSEVQYRYPDNPDSRQASLRHHGLVLEAVRAGDAERVSAAMAEHIRNVGERLWNG